jgi:glyoxalase family protein
VIALADRDGLRIELIEAAGPGGADGGADGAPTDDGFHSVTCGSGSRADRARADRPVRLREAGREAAGDGTERLRFRSPAGGRGSVVDLVRSGAPSIGRQGAGTIHHVAFRAETREIQREWRERVAAFGLDVTPVVDRQYFDAIYFREPGGVLFEIATDPPGFAADEAEASSARASSCRRATRGAGRTSSASCRRSGCRGVTDDPHARGPVAQGGAPLSRARLAMILVHGRGGGARDMLALAEHLALPDVACMAPEAAGHSWWPRSFLAPIAANEPWLSSGLAAVGRVAEDLERQGFGRERTVLLGFSQGACLALEYAARSGGAFRAVVGLSGGLVGTADADDGPRATTSTATRASASTTPRPASTACPCSWAATSATRTFPSRGCGRPRRCSGAGCRRRDADPPRRRARRGRGGGPPRARPPQPEAGRGRVAPASASWARRKDRIDRRPRARRAPRSPPVLSWPPYGGIPI